MKDTFIFSNWKKIFNAILLIIKRGKADSRAYTCFWNTALIFIEHGKSCHRFLCRKKKKKPNFLRDLTYWKWENPQTDWTMWWHFLVYAYILLRKNILKLIEIKEISFVCNIFLFLISEYFFWYTGKFFRS